MTEDQADEAIASAFVAGMATVRPGVPVVLDNEPIDLPTTGSLVYLATQGTTSQALTQGMAGTRKVQRNGWATVKLWTPASTGGRDAKQLARDVRQLLEMTSFPSPTAGDEPVYTQAAAVQPIGQDGRWWIVLVRVPFWYIETV